MHVSLLCLVCTQVEQKFKVLWADHGDQVSTQYAGEGRGTESFRCTHCWRRVFHLASGSTQRRSAHTTGFGQDPIGSPSQLHSNWQLARTVSGTASLHNGCTHTASGTGALNRSRAHTASGPGYLKRGCTHTASGPGCLHRGCRHTASGTGAVTTDCTQTDKHWIESR